MFFIEFNQTSNKEAKLTLVTSVLLVFLLFFFADYVLADHDTSGRKISTRAACGEEHSKVVSEKPVHT